MKKIKEVINKLEATSDKIKKILLGLALAGLSCAIWHNYIQIFNIGKLNGYKESTSRVPLNVKNWFSADYQQNTEENLVLGNLLSPFFIRVSNQIDYSLFGKFNSHGSLFGKDEYMYQQVYIDTYLGKDLLAEDILRGYIEKMKFIQDTLKKLNKEFVYIQAPGKACYYPEFLPSEFSSQEADTNNYKILKRLLDEYKINYIDFRPFFLEAKNKTEYPLFTRTGIHWSKYAMSIVKDSINNYIEKTRKIDLPEVHVEEMDIGYGRTEDVDLESLLNLLFKITDDVYAYPQYKFGTHENKDVPVVLMIGDSYLGNLYWDNFYESFDLKSQFWFYNSTVCSISFLDQLHKFQLNQLQVVKNSDVVILGCTEPNIKGTSWSFIDDTYDYYKNGITIPKHKVNYKQKVDSCIKTLKESDMYRVENYSRKQNVSIDSAKTIFCLWKLYPSLY